MELNAGKLINETHENYFTLFVLKSGFTELRDNF